MKGNLNPVIHHFKNEMEQCAEDMEFEKAEIIRKKIEHLQNYKAKSKVVNENLGTVDVFSILKEGDIAYVNYLMVQEGTIIQTQTIVLETKLEETEQKFCYLRLRNLRKTFKSEAKEIIVPFTIEYPEEEMLIYHSKRRR